MNTTENNRTDTIIENRNDSLRDHSTGGWSNGGNEWEMLHATNDDRENESRDDVHPHVHTSIKSGGWENHNEQALHVHTNMKSGGWENHNEGGVRVRTGMKSGGWENHNEGGMAARRP